MESVLKKESVIATSEKIVKRAMENYIATGKFNEYVKNEKEKVKSLKKKLVDIKAEDYCKKEYLGLEKIMQASLLNVTKLSEESEIIIEKYAKCLSKYHAYLKPLSILEESLDFKVLVEPHQKFFSCETDCLARFVLDHTKEKELYQCMMKCWERFLPDLDDHAKEIREMVDITLDDLKNRKI